MVHISNPRKKLSRKVIAFIQVSLINNYIISNLKVYHANYLINVYTCKLSEQLCKATTRTINPVLVYLILASELQINMLRSN